jgi:hypothetical protein
MEEELIDLQAGMLMPREFNRDYRVECQLLRLLLNRDITTFSFPPDLNSDFQPLVTDLWKSLLAEQPPDIHTIISRYSDFRLTNYLRESWNMRPFFNCMLDRLPNLTVLQLEQFPCKNADLIKIAKQLPKLW